MFEDNQLILGILLIVIGIAFGLMAYAVMLNRNIRDSAEEAAEEEVEEGEAAEPEHGAREEEAADEPAAAEPAENDLGGEPESVPEAELGVPPPASPVSKEPEPAESLEAAPDLPSTEEPVTPTAQEPPEAEKAPHHGERIPIATLYRDEVTGSLMVQIGEEVYTSHEDIIDPSDQRKIRYAAADLSKWFESAPAVRRRSFSEPTEEPSQEPINMLEQINIILDRKLSEAGSEMRGVRLTTAVDGSVRVYIGLNSYELDQVPDAQIRQFIREAVAEWEESQ